MKTFYTNVALIQQDTEKEKTQVNSDCPQNINFLKIYDLWFLIKDK